jgi:hypothetical protein
MFPMSKKVCNVAIAATALATASLAASGNALAIQCVKAPCQLPTIKPAVPAILTKPAVPAIFTKPAVPAILTKPAPIQVITPARPILPATITLPQPPKIHIDVNVVRPMVTPLRPERPFDGKGPERLPIQNGKGPVVLPYRDSQAEAERAAAAARAAAAEAKRLSRPKVIYVGSPAPVAPAPVAAPAPVTAPAPIAAPAPAPTCLTKEYLQAGTVLFKDVCTNQFAMNSTTLPSQVVTAATRACLTKENLQAGTVLFKDICTNEWAMNPPDQQAQAPQTSPVPQVR